MNYQYVLKTGASVVLMSALTLNVSQARDNAPGYLEDSWGNIVTSGAGECIHTGQWKQEMSTVVGCDGVVLNAQVKTLKGTGTGQLIEVTIPTTTMFAFDSANLTEEGKASIESHRDVLTPELAKAYAIIIIGHTDSQGDAQYNQRLSLKRSESVRDYLVETGANPEKLRVVGRGASEPIASNETKEGRAKNRRVEVVVVGEVRALDAMLFPSVALFERRSAELTDAGKALIEKYRMQAQAQMRSARYIEIVGHTDDVGDDAYNQDLSEQRAMNVFKYLAETGMDVSNVTIKGMGEKMPIASNQTDEGRAENRRVEILLLGRDR
ncbi:MAG: OmpA family protein [Candidatus Thiodiazotropha sp.]